MSSILESTVDTRADTDASLGAERASTDVDAARMAGRSRRALDDLIERDRLRADALLSRLRTNADALLARKRSALPTRDRAVVAERNTADEAKIVEREEMDARIDEERRQAKVIVEAEREEQQAHRARHEGRRQDTDSQLSTERRGADATAEALHEVEHALASTEEQQSRQSDVFGMVTHDIRSPLTVIAMNASTIVDVSQEPEMREAAHDIMLAAARMDRLLTDLLDVARIESATFRVVKRPHDMGALLSEVHRSYRSLFEARGMTFVHEPPSTPLVASFDHDRIVQVLSNLLVNAMKFQRPGGKIELRLVQSGDHAELTVRDDGPGIPPHDVPFIFERFWKLDSDARRGLGLGLYICAKIVEAHGGRIWVESQIGEGATFRFTLPIAQL